MSMFTSCHELLTIRDATRWIRSQTGVTPSIETVHRWIRKGVRGRVLPSQRIGGVWYVAPDDLSTFIDSGNRRRAVAVAPATSSRPTARPSPTQQEKKAASKTKLLDRLGRRK